MAKIEVIEMEADESKGSEAEDVKA